MSVFDLFSKRQKRLRGEVPDVYVYDTFPEKLRIQIVHIIRNTLGDRQFDSTHSNEAYQFLHDTLCREYGMFQLTPKAGSNKESLIRFFLDSDDIEQVVDVVELTFRVIDTHVRNHNYQNHASPTQTPDDAIDELNARLKEQGVGYRFESGEMIRVDSAFDHQEIVKPALSVLRAGRFRGANEEFLKAHEHYRHNRYKECLVESLKAFESTMKQICVERSWSIPNSATARVLIEICFQNELVPSYLQSHFTALRSLLESGVPTIRNRGGGHGQGTEPSHVPEYIARYALQETAANIVLLASAHEEKN